MSADTVPIPEVPGIPLLGNFLDIDLDFPLGSFLQFAEKYGASAIDHPQLCARADLHAQARYIVYASPVARSSKWSVLSDPALGAPPLTSMLADDTCTGP